MWGKPNTWETLREVIRVFVSVWVDEEGVHQTKEEEEEEVHQDLSPINYANYEGVVCSFIA